MVGRSRTGCLTCRKRKLKCDEVHPVCGQCTKAHRECVPSEPLVFRHQQNASMNNDEDGALKRFYSYKNTFKKDHVWVPIPSPVTFVHITDPFADDQPGSGQAPHVSFDPSASYQNIASHSLEALSTAATANQPSYIPQSSFTDQLALYATYSNSPPRVRHVRDNINSSSPTNNAAHQNNNISFLLNPPSTSLTGVIDPNLEASTPQNGQDGSSGPRGSKSPETKREDVQVEQPPGHSDQQVADLLRNFSETQGQ